VEWERYKQIARDLPDGKVLRLEEVERASESP
jgi:hypothetical protein